jgi:hypothetical protein
MESSLLDRIHDFCRLCRKGSIVLSRENAGQDPFADRGSVWLQDDKNDKS